MLLHRMLLNRVIQAGVLALTASLLAPAQTLARSGDLEEAKKLVVTIEGTLNGEPTQGAGIVFAVSDGWTYIATAYHVIRRGDERAAPLKVRFYQQQLEAFDAEHFAEARTPIWRWCA
jgi:hypothetical protein